MRRNAATQTTRTRVWEGEVTTVRGRCSAPARPQDEDARRRARPTRREARAVPRRHAGRPAARSAERMQRARGARRSAWPGRWALAKGLRGTRRRRPASQIVDALRGVYRTPWELALQRWLESVAPGRAHVRAAVAPRRGAHRRRPARAQARRLDSQRRARHQRLDDRTRSRARSARSRSSATRSGVDQVRLVQCDAAVTADELVRRTTLAQRESHRLRRQRPVARAATISPTIRTCAPRSSLTDGDIAYPRGAPCPTTCCGCCRRAARGALRAAVRPRGRRCSLPDTEKQTMKVIQELVAYFDRRGRLDQGSRSGSSSTRGFLAAEAPLHDDRTSAIRSARPTTSASPARSRGRSGVPTSTPATPPSRWRRCMPALVKRGRRGDRQGHRRGSRCRGTRARRSTA